MPYNICAVLGTSVRNAIKPISKRPSQCRARAAAELVRRGGSTERFVWKAGYYSRINTTTKHTAHVQELNGLTSLDQNMKNRKCDT
ncbi:unnamed protein product, partial [Trichogramma brassicae]